MKTSSTFYTPERVANARRNIERYEWASEKRDRAVEAAARFACQSDDWLWSLITPQSIPRAIHTSMQLGCPNCGKEVYKFGNYPWKVDVINRPWKIECPSCNEIYPKNDFAAFYESGKDELGVFDRERADRSLLFNADHPDPNDPLHTHGVDDTMGWIDATGGAYRFIGYYGHYGIWEAVRSALNSFRDAYLFTGDHEYARKAGLMLCRIADFYPDMDWGWWGKLGFTNSDGLWGYGKIFGRIWETELVTAFASTYDAIFSTLDAAQRAHIENDILREIHDAMLRQQIVGNEGMHQYAMAMAAIVLDEPGTSDEWLDWIWKPGDILHGDARGGNLLPIIEEKTDDDGMGDEASPGYNGIWRHKFRAISDLLDLYPRYKGVRFTDLPKYRKMFETPARLVCIDRYIPNIGDCYSTSAPGFGASSEEMAHAYRTFGDPRFAQMAWFLNGNKTDGIRGDIFEAEPESIANEIEAVIAEHGPIVHTTDEMPHYGLTILRSGSGDDSRALSLYYGRNCGHGHKDSLYIELFGFGLSLMPDLGYPEFAFFEPSRFQWTEHTISHSTVTVDNHKQWQSIRGKSSFVVEGRGVSAVEASAPDAYPHTSLYQRTVAMVDVSDTDFYVVDIFRVKGGKEHMYGLHGAEGEVETEGLSLIDQPRGTLAGEDIPYAADLGGEDGHWRDSTGFQYLYNIRRDAQPLAQPAITYKVVDTRSVLPEPKDIRLRMNLVNPPGEVILAHGEPPQNRPGNPRRLQYVLLPNKQSESTFVSILEPYVGSRTISKIERKDDGDTVTLTITTASGRVDTIVSALEPITTKIAGTSFAGRLGVVSEENGKTETRISVE